MKEILQLLKQKWAEYLLEILVIIVGIVAAFSLDAWHTSNIEEDNLIAVFKKAQLNIDRNVGLLEDWQSDYLEDLETNMIALQIIEDKETVTEGEAKNVAEALSRVMILGSRNYDVRTLELLVANLPVIEPNLKLIDAVDGLINQINRGTGLIDLMHQHLFAKETLLDKDVFWFDRNGNAVFGYEALRGNKQIIDYMIRGYRWKSWTRHFEGKMIKEYTEVNALINERLEELGAYR